MIPDDSIFSLSNNGATFSDDGLRRRRLWRTIDDSWERDRVALWVMLNPSIAGAEENDPTIRRVLSFSRDAGCNRVVVVNLCDVVCTDPKALPVLVHPQGMPLVDDEADAFVAGAAAEVEPPHRRGAMLRRNTGIVMLAWGSLDNLSSSIREDMKTRALAMTSPDGPLRKRAPTAELLHLGLTAGGHPKHPLYLASATTPERWSPQ